MTAATITAAPAAAVRTSDAVAVIVPAEPAEATKSWRRLVTGIDPSQRAGAWQLQGPWLKPGVAYELPAGAVVVAVDQYPNRWHITMSTAALGGLETVKEWDRKSPMGKQVTDWIARRLPQGAAFHRYRLLDELPNRWAGRCAACRRTVPAGAGRVVDIDGRNRVMHLKGKCPPPPQVITPNRRAEECLLCGRWVPAGTGVALRTEQRDPVTGSWYRAAHQSEGGGCPADALPGPTNRTSGWCDDCGELVQPGQGYWLREEASTLHHAGACPAPKLTGPSWIVRRPRHEPAYQVGDVRRVGIDLRRGGPQVPDSTPGFRVLSEQYVEMVGLVAECVQRRRGQWARVVPATWTEAADLLADDAASALAARPDAGGFPARWRAERIGDVQPWLAEITGRDPDYGYRREFIPPDRDYSQSNSRGTRGVWFNWTLLPNRVYEALEPLSRRHTERRFLRATPAGDVIEISRQEVEAWLNHAPTWHAS